MDIKIGQPATDPDQVLADYFSQLFEESPRAITAPSAVTSDPCWAEKQTFDCIVMIVAGVRIACVLSAIDHPKPWPANAKLSGGNPMFPGAVEIGSRQLQLVDLERVLFPKRPGRPNGPDGLIVVPMQWNDWALIVDDLAGTTLVDPDTVHWKKDHSNRPWLAGMISSANCALLEPIRLSDLLTEEMQESGVN